MTEKIFTYAKGHVALVGFALTLIAALWPGSAAAHDAAIGLGALAALGVYVVPNKTKTEARKIAKAVHKDAGLALIEVLVVVLLVLVVLILLGYGH